MFISSAQCDLIEKIYEVGQLDLLECNISVLSALRVRGLVEIVYATKRSEYSYAELTTAGAYAAENIDYYRAPARYVDVRNKLHDAKYA